MPAGLKCPMGHFAVVRLDTGLLLCYACLKSGDYLRRDL